MMAPDAALFEKLGVFYLGRTVRPEGGATSDELLLYDARDLTTHAVCVGMTGSGKTGLCLSLLEEAAIDGIPAIAVDPKGDLGNLLLAFPGLAAADFRPWIDDAEAARAGEQPDAYAGTVAARWRDGLAKWGEDGSRIARFREAAETVIYTPGSTAGLPLAVLKSFAAPPREILEDAEALRERIGAAVSGLLALAGIEADPVQSREHILLSTILQAAWTEGRDLDLPTLIAQVQKPPVARVGVMDIDTFFPQRDRAAFALRINNLLAAPGFQTWLEGEPLDVQRLLWTPEGRPRIAILSIAHLGDAERMFFVTLLLNEIIAWMRRQPGTPSLRAIFYMDEIFGYFPPTAAPPSKQPMLTLLKQARAFGLGIVLSTQNPVDLDYKGLSNAGTWFIGRLQTERDKMRVLEGLEGASAAAGASFDRAAYERTLAGLRSRVFLMNNVHEDAPVLFETRWLLSYLRGPLTRAQIQTLMAGRPGAPAAGGGAAAAGAPSTAAAAQASAAWPSAPAPGASAGTGLRPGPERERPIVPPEAAEAFAAVVRQVPGARLVYRPALYGLADLHFVQGTQADLWQAQGYIAPLGADAGALAWDAAEPSPQGFAMRDLPEPGSSFAEAPPAALNAKSYDTWKKSFASYLYQNAVVKLYQCPAFKISGKAGETEADLRIRLREAVREGRDRDLEKLRARYAPKLASLQDRIRRAEERISREQSQYQQQQVQTAISVGATVLGAILGRRSRGLGSIGRATTAARGAGRAAREKQDVARASAEAAEFRQQLASLEAEFQAAAASLAQSADPDTAPVTELVVRPRKADTTIRRLSLAWLPAWVGPDGAATDAWR